MSILSGAILTVISLSRNSSALPPSLKKLKAAAARVILQMSCQAIPALCIDSYSATKFTKRAWFTGLSAANSCSGSNIMSKSSK